MTIPVVHVSAAARRAIETAAEESGERALRIAISDAFDHELRFDARGEDDVAIEIGSVAILLDPASAARAEGLRLDFVEREGDAGFVVDNPNVPKVLPISATELKALADSGRYFVLVDVRTPQERVVARIEGSRLLDEASYPELMTLDRDAPLVFQCHHGIRSQAAAEHFVREGFRNVFNLEGGIDAWSTMVDPSVPRY